MKIDVRSYKLQGNGKIFVVDLKGLFRAVDGTVTEGAISVDALDRLKVSLVCNGISGVVNVPRGTEGDCHYVLSEDGTTMTVTVSDLPSGMNILTIGCRLGTLTCSVLQMMLLVGMGRGIDEAENVTFAVADTLAGGVSKEVEKILGLLEGDEYYKAHVYGVFIPDGDPSTLYDNPAINPKIRRVGAPELHRTLPVQSQMEGGVLTDEGVFTPFDNQDDWTQATQKRDGSEGQVMVRLPEYWRNILDVEEGPYGAGQYWLISDVEIEGFERVPEMFTASDEGVIDRKEGKLCSIVNDGPRYRGGLNKSEWDGTYRSQLGKCAGFQYMEDFRMMARRRGKGWETHNIYDRQTLLIFFVIEYATRNSQDAIDYNLTTEGYHQGGLGHGVTEIVSSAWSSYNSYGPLIPCGINHVWGAHTDEYKYDVPSATPESTEPFATVYPNAYRGVSNIFGHYSKYCDGFKLFVYEKDANKRATKFSFFVAKDNVNWGDGDVLNPEKYTETARFPHFDRTKAWALWKLSALGFLPLITGPGGTDMTFCNLFNIDSIPDTVTLPSTLCPILYGRGIDGEWAGLFYTGFAGTPTFRGNEFTTRLCYCKEFAEVPTPEPYSSIEVAVTKSGEGAADGVVYGTGFFQTGDNVTLRAEITAEGFEFKKWVRDGSDVTTNPLVISSIQEGETVEAVFGAVEE